MMHLESDTKGKKIVGDRYYLHRLIAQTNHSKVFFATDMAINDRKCAIKQMYPSYCPVKMRSQVESAFLHEAEILKQFSKKHPQICQFYNYSIDSGNQYLVQEWVEGTILEARLCQGSNLSESEAKKILLNILLTLEYIHDRGIVHNDIKPDNIILRSQDGLPVLIDFGIARKVNSDYSQNIVGTPGYMSLEQAMGKASFQNDLYSLSITTIYLLTGKSPLLLNFDSPEDNFWNREKTAFDPKLVAVIDRAISPQSEGKFNSAKEMRDMLQDSAKILVSKPLNRDRSESELRNSILTIILAMLGLCFYLSYLTSLSNEKPPAEIVGSPETKHSTVS